MGFSLQLRGAPKAEIDARVQRAAEILGLEPYLERFPAPALRRPAPARRDGPRHRARSAGVPVRRAAVEPRRQAARADAHRDQGAAPAAQDHDDLRHPRPDRGHDHGRQDRRHARRPGRADRRAARALRPAGQPVRRGLHRLAGDEFPARARSARTARPRSKGRTACSLPLHRRPPAPTAGRRSTASGRSISSSPTTAPKPRSRWSSRPARRRRSSRKLGGEDIIAVFRERHQFKPGDKIRLKPDPRLVHLFDEATGQATERRHRKNTTEERP